jgi:hypothetical protein
MRLVIKYHYDKPEFVNIQADRIEEKDGLILAYKQDKLVAVVYASAVDMAYLSGELEKGDKP